MADRITRVVLEAEIANFEKNMRAASDATKKAADEGDRLAKTHKAMSEVGRAAMVMGAAVGAGVALAVKKFMDFDQAMSNVDAATHESASNMALLRDAALEAGARTVFSATEAANAVEELAKAGVSTADILSGGLDAALDLAAAGGMGVADAAAVAATTLKQFNLEGKDTSHVADLLAAGAGKAQGDVSDMSQALKQGGLVANQFGLSVDETVGTLSAFASAGMLGSDAGTSFRTMLLRLANPSGEAADKMKELGINAYDAQGKFVGMEGLAGQLQSRLKGLTQEQQNAALAIIFGQDAIRGANVLLQQGADGIADWTKKVNDQGYAADTAAKRLDNLKGDWEAFTGAMDTALISMGEGANGPLRDLVQGLTNLVDGFNDLPDPMKQGILWAGLVTAGVGLLGGAALVAVPKIAQFKVALQTLNVTGSSVRSGMGRFASFLGGPWAVAIVAATTVVSLLIGKQEEGRQKAKEYANTLEASSHKITKATGDLVNENLSAKDSFLWWETPSAYDRAEDLGVSLGVLRDAALGSTESLEKLRDMQEKANAAVIEAHNAGNGTVTQMKERKASIDAMVDSVIGENDSINEAIRVSKQKQTADGKSTKSSKDSAKATKTAADAYLDESDSARKLTDQLSKLIDKINEANGVGQDAITANANYQAALAGISDEVQRQKDAYKEAHKTLNGFVLSLDQSTESGSANAASLSDVAAAAQDAAKAQFEQDKTTMTAEESTQKYIDTLNAQRQAFIDSAVKAGYNRDEVAKLADQVFKLPDKKEIEVLADTTRAQWTLTDYMNKFGTLRGTIEYRAQLPDLNGSASGSGRPGLAAGGIFHNKEKAFANSGFEPGIYRYTPGGIHKFAEEYDEAYISGDPARFDRSKQVWLRAGQEFGFMQPQVNVAAPSLEGLPITGTLDLGNGLTGVIHAVVMDAQQAAATPFKRGRR